ncbi:PH domain-containing protein [Gordonia sp. ABSL1-1]|uniref:PH domain-containing protein n=1 Tax=Gordonia sp. ABSL1-1 TaxID=3053923 RepID=UPI002572CC31|nr:PH domain-containing protein [Gordonia sp. ABSL1-1]MDL9935590.1 PH domain-containing protein [Gordonia sp. ABSL1-1]
MPSNSSDRPSPDRRSPDAEPTGPELPVEFRINRVAYFTVPMALIVAVILAGTSLVWLGWTLALPVLLGFWIHRLRTIVTADGLRAVGTFGTRDIAWTNLSGLQFPRWSAVRAVTEDGRRVRLPAVGFSDLPRLSQASGGRIPDPFAAAADADK